MLQISRITPCYRFGGCWVVSTSLEFLKISIYFSAMILCTLSKTERKTDGQDADTAGPRVSNCMFFQLSIAKRDEIQDDVV